MANRFGRSVSPWNTSRTASNFLFSMETRDKAGSGRAWGGSPIVPLAREVARLGVAFFHTLGWGGATAPMCRESNDSRPQQ